MTSILVLRGGAIGDFIVTLPTLEGIRRRHPDARIELVGNRTAAAIVERRGLLDAVHSQHDAVWASLYAPPPLPPDLRGRLEAFDAIVNFWPDPDGELRRHFPVRAGQQFITAAALPETAPAASHYLNAVAGLGAERVPLFYRLAEPRADARRIAIHPGSGSPRKNWPVDRWREFARRLSAADLGDLLVIRGPAEPPGVLQDIGEHAEAIPLRDLLERLRACRLFVGHDSGISHLAAATGIPCVLLFGPTDPAVWAPPASWVTVLRAGESLEDLSVEAVAAAVVSR